MPYTLRPPIGKLRVGGLKAHIIIQKSYGPRQTCVGPISVYRIKYLHNIMSRNRNYDR